MTEFWGVVSGKGGVGKTFIASSLGVTLSKLGKKVLLIDYDLSGANLHNVMGVKNFKKSIQDFKINMDDIRSLITTSGFSRVDIIPGFIMPKLNNELELLTIENMLSQLRKLNYDFVIFDMGPGASNSNFTLMSVMTKNFIITSGEPSALDKTEQFFQHLIISQQPIENLNLVINSCRTQQHKQSAPLLAHKLKTQHNVKLQNTYTLSFDNAVWQSANMNSTAAKHVLSLMPYAEIGHEFFKICKQVIAHKELRAVS